MKRWSGLSLLLIAATAGVAADTPAADVPHVAAPPPDAAKPEAPKPDAGGAPAWQRPRVFLGALVEDGGSFDGKPMPRVTRMIPGSALEKLGVKEGDQLAQLNGTALTTSESYRTLTAALNPGDALKFTVIHDGVSREITGVAEAAPRPRDVLADTEGIKAQVAQLKDDVERTKVRSNLEETLRLLNQFEAGLPAAAADFKRVYPGGTFNIQVHIDIRSEAGDTTAKPLSPAVVKSPAAKEQVAVTDAAPAQVPIPAKEPAATPVGTPAAVTAKPAAPTP